MKPDKLWYYNVCYLKKKKKANKLKKYKKFGPSSTFKLWGRSRVPGSQGTGFRGPGPTFSPYHVCTAQKLKLTSKLTWIDSGERVLGHPNSIIKETPKSNLLLLEWTISICLKRFKNQTCPKLKILIKAIKRLLHF